LLRYGRLGVESFFVLAGYFLVHMFRPSEVNHFSVRRFLTRRMVRLAVPYWVVVFLQVGLIWSVHWTFDRDNNPPGVGYTLPVLLFVQDVVGDHFAMSYPLWSMATLIQFYFLWALAFWVVRRIVIVGTPDRFQALTHRLMIALTSAILLGSLALQFTPSGEQWQLPRMAWALALGCLLYWHSLGLMSAGLVFLALGSTLFTGLYLEHVWCVKAVACGLLLLALGNGLRFPNAAVTRWLAALGSRSYSVYLVHGIVGIRIVNWAVFLDHGSLAVTAGLFVAGVVASLAVSLAFYGFVERPTARFAQTVDYRR
jgi:peptidoglycan/LPS O-acetylase OafA/YrhL